MKRSGIYKITNKITGCVYIGSSRDLEVRLSKYKESECPVTRYIKESIKTHGINNHEIKVICLFDSDIPKKELEIYEDGFILIYLNRLGEDMILNSRCNDRKKWMSKRYKLSRKKNGNHGIFGKDNKLSKKVNQYSLDGTFIKTWDSIHDIYRFYNKEINGNITMCCTGKRNQAYGFKWSYYNEKES